MRKSTALFLPNLILDIIAAQTPAQWHTCCARVVSLLNTAAQRQLLTSAGIPSVGSLDGLATHACMRACLALDMLYATGWHKRSILHRKCPELYGEYCWLVHRLITRRSTFSLDVVSAIAPNPREVRWRSVQALSLDLKTNSRTCGCTIARQRSY